MMLKFQVLLLSALLLRFSRCANILLMPVPHYSHVNFFSVVGQTLKVEGHNIRVLTTSNLVKTVERHGLIALVPDIPPPVLVSNDESDPGMNVFTNGNPLNIMYSLSGNANQYCIDFMENANAMDMLAREMFDIVLIDTFDLFRCHFMFPYKLGLRYVAVTARHDPWTVRIPALPSMEPQLGLFVPTGSPTFLQRLTNLIASCAVQTFLPPFAAVDDSLVPKYIPERPPKTFSQLYIESEMWFVNLEPVCLDFPRVQGLHYQFFGGLGTEPARELPADWKEFVGGAESGLIVMSFGSALKNIPLDLMKKMLQAFERVPQRIAMRYDGPVIDNVPENVRLSKWIPQNDLLGQNETKLFITHSGNNGQLEALYHGVPMLGMPVFGDQVYNAERATFHGFGLHLDTHNFASNDLYEKMREVISNPKYKESITKCSAIFRSLPNPQKSLAFWVDHVLKFGGSHLQPPFMDMPLWKFFMLDVLLFLFLASVSVAFCCCWCCTRITKKCLARGQSPRVKKD